MGLNGLDVAKRSDMNLISIPKELKPTRREIPLLSASAHLPQNLPLPRILAHQQRNGAAAATTIPERMTDGRTGRLGGGGGGGVFQGHRRRDVMGRSSSFS